MSEWNRILIYIKKNKFTLFVCLFFALIFVSATTLIPLFTGFCVNEIDKVIKHIYPSLDKSNFFIYLIVNASLIVFAIVFQFTFDYLINNTMEKISKQLKDDVFEKLNRVAIKYIDSKSHGDLVSIIINDVENINNGLISAFKQLYQGSIQIIITLIIMFIYNWMLALVVIVLTPLTFIITYTIAKKGKESFKKQAKIVGEMSGTVLESFNNIDILKSFNYEEQSFNKYQIQNNELYKAGQRAQFVSSFTNPFTRLINYIVYASVGLLAAILCVLAKNNENNILLGASCSVGTIVTFIQFSNQFAKPFNEISSCVTELQTATSSLKRINKLLNEENDIDEGKIDNIDNIDNITFNHLYFSYDPNKSLIQDFSLNIKKGMKVAIVGPTGCGKTTLINLLLRFYDPLKGSINLNDVCSFDLTKKALRNNFTMVLQDTWIFSGTVRDNLSYGKADATDEEIIEACKKADCYDFIKHLGNGLDTYISDTSGLSTGQKQLISIARIILKLSPIVILDEATSNIDTRTEIKISKAFDKIMEGKTSFVIAHRLSTIKQSDLIIVMKDGKIIETGDHKTLLNKKGFYYELYNAQYVNL